MRNTFCETHALQKINEDQYSNTVIYTAILHRTAKKIKRFPFYNENTFKIR